MNETSQNPTAITDAAPWAAGVDLHAPETPKPVAKPQGWWEQTKASFQAAMPQWVRDNSSRINQIGLVIGTSVMIGSVFRGREISKDIFAAQKKLLQDEGGFHGEALEKKVAELIEAKVMKKPVLHRQRMIYLPTAITGLAVGGFIKDKETPEERAARKPMSLPEYMGMRLQQSLDPLHHSRQTAGVIGTLSGVAAIVSALSQPGGALISEAFVGSTLIAGFSGLTFIDDPAKAKETLNVCWATRLPFVLSGTYETLLTKPGFVHPLAAELKQTTAYSSGLLKAMQEGVKVPRLQLSGLVGSHVVKGGKAADAYTKSFVSRQLPYNRMDICYPIGQWFNMAMASFGFLMAGSDEKRHAAPAGGNALPAMPVQTAPVQTSVTQGPATQISAVQQAAKLQPEMPGKVAAVA